MLKKIIPILFLFVGFQANAAIITLEESFSEYGPPATVQSGFSWLFDTTGAVSGDVSITFIWEGMDFDKDDENFRLKGDGIFFGYIGSDFFLPGFGGNTSCVLTSSGASSDCSGSRTFDLTFMVSNLFDSTFEVLAGGFHNVNSWGAAEDGFGSVKAMLTFQDSSSVPEPSIIALFGIGLVGLGFARRKRQS